MFGLNKSILMVSMHLLLLLSGSHVNANTHSANSCEAKWQALKTSPKKIGRLNYAELFSKCRIEKPKFVLPKEQPIKRKSNVTVILKSPPTPAPSTKMVINEMLPPQKQCLVEWKAVVASSNLKRHPSWPRFLKQCKQRLKLKPNNN